jgi:hypothetical protein
MREWRELAQKSPECRGGQHGYRANGAGQFQVKWPIEEPATEEEQLN